MCISVVLYLRAGPSTLQHKAGYRRAPLATHMTTQEPSIQLIASLVDGNSHSLQVWYHLVFN